MKVLLLPPPTCLFLTADLRDIVPEGMRVERSFLSHRKGLFSFNTPIKRPPTNTPCLFA